MILNETRIKGVFEIEPELKEDERGYFARVFSDDEFRARGIDPAIRQINRSFNTLAGTLRGIHYQKDPCWEQKMMLCMSGSLFVAVIDLRKDSDTYREWLSFEISAENKKQLVIPEGCANGFETLVDRTEVLYGMSKPYSQAHAAGIHYQDPQFAIPWPLPMRVVSERDKTLPTYAD